MWVKNSFSRNCRDTSARLPPSVTLHLGPEVAATAAWKINGEVEAAATAASVKAACD